MFKKVLKKEKGWKCYMPDKCNSYNKTHPTGSCHLYFLECFFGFHFDICLWSSVWWRREAIISFWEFFRSNPFKQLWPLLYKTAELDLRSTMCFKNLIRQAHVIYIFYIALGISLWLYSLVFDRLSIFILFYSFLCLSAFQSLCNFFYIFFTACLPNYSPAQLSISLSPFVYVFHLTVCLYAYLLIYLSVYPPIHMSFYMRFYLIFCLSPCLLSLLLL